MTSKEKQIMQCLLYVRRHIGEKVTHKQIKDTFNSVQVKIAFSHLYNLGYLEKIGIGVYVVKSSCNTNLDGLLNEVKQYDRKKTTLWQNANTSQ